MKHHRVEYPTVPQAGLMILIIALAFFGLSIGGCASGPGGVSGSQDEAATLAAQVQGSRAALQAATTHLEDNAGIFTEQEWQQVEAAIGSLDRVMDLAVSISENPAIWVSVSGQLTREVVNARESYNLARDSVKARINELTAAEAERLRSLERELVVYYAAFTALQVDTGSADVNQALHTAAQLAITGAQIYGALHGIPPV